MFSVKVDGYLQRDHGPQKPDAFFTLSEKQLVIFVIKFELSFGLATCVETKQESTNLACF